MGELIYSLNVYTNLISVRRRVLKSKMYMIKTFSDVREDIVNFIVFQLIWIQNSENNKWRSWLAIQSAVTPTSSFI